jgi:DNA-binding LytR/AlgR family response regulator
MRGTTMRIAAGGGVAALVLAAGVAGVGQISATGMLPPWAAVAMVATVGAVAAAVGVAVVRALAGRLAAARHGPDDAPVAASPDASPAAAAAPRGYLERFQVEVRDGVKLVRAADVEWIEAAGNYVRLHVSASALASGAAPGQRPRGADAYLYRQSLARLEEQLDPATFLRIHRSTIVNLDRVERMDPHPTGDADVRLASGQVVRLSRRYAQAFHQRTGRSASGRDATAARGR